jgi:hypothetical protein
MSFFRTIPKLTVLVAATAVGMSACSDEQSTAAVDRSTGVPLKLEVSSPTAAPGTRIAVAVNLDVIQGTTGVVQGALEFDQARLRYVGQSPSGSAITMVNAKNASQGKLRFLSGNSSGIAGRVALFVFEAKTGNYLSSIRYVPQMAASAGGNTRQLSTKVIGTSVNESLSVPTDASMMTVQDWAARIIPAGSANAGVSAAPGEYSLNLQYGDIDFNNAIDGNDFLAVANAAVGNDQIIIDTDGPSVDRDLVIAGNVFPTNSAGACGTEADGSRVLDGNDFIAIANRAVGTPETCAGTLIPGRGPLATNRVTVSGNLTGTINWTKNNVYQLDGLVTVKDLGTLNIEAGTRIEGNSAINPSALFVERGGAIFAVGTQNEPVVFTCTAATKTPGCWGGVWISGKGTANTPAATTVGQSPAFAARTGQAPVAADAGGCNQQLAETGNAPTYGGCTANDNSGRLSYVRIEFGGFIVAPNRELNNLTLAAVGSGTQIDHVQMHGGSDDGLEFFGGNVNTSFLVITGNNDDGFDGSDGYNGTSQFVIIQNDRGDITTGADSRAIEMDNFGTSNTNAPRTSPRMFNFTILGDQVNRASTAAMMLRRGTGAKLFNSIVSGWPAGVSIRNAETCNTFGDGIPAVLSTTFMDVATLGSASDNALTGSSAPAVCLPGTAALDAGEAQFLSLQPGYRARNASGGVAGIQQALFDGLSATLPDFRMRFAPGGSSPIEGGVETVPAGLVQTDYRGAVGTLSGGQIPWYSGWTRGFTSQLVP